MLKKAVLVETNSAARAKQGSQQNGGSLKNGGGTQNSVTQSSATNKQNGNGSVTPVKKASGCQPSAKTDGGFVMRVEIGAIKNQGSSEDGSITALEVDFILANHGANLIPDDGHVWMYTSF